MHSAWIIRIWARDCHLQVFKIYISTKYIEWWCQLQTLPTQVFGSKLHRFRTPNMVLPFYHQNTVPLWSPSNSSTQPMFPSNQSQHSLFINTTIALDPWFFQHGGCTGFNWKMQHHLLVGGFNPFEKYESNCFYMSFNNLKIHIFYQGDWFGNASWYHWRWGRVPPDLEHVFL